jgi:hypothetical protein
MKRRMFEMSEEDMGVLMKASTPVPLVMLNVGKPRSAQENANAAWEALGKKLKFKYMTVMPDRGLSFTAEPLTEEE